MLFNIIHYPEIQVTPSIVCMEANRHEHSALNIVLVGLAALASAMGVGRFAFTPLFPLMQAHDGLSLGQGAWLASANYLGYWVGALACSVAPPMPRTGARFGLVAVAICTLAMGVTGSGDAWLALRFGAGVASACVLVGVSAWALPALAERGRSAWSGWVFAGVGVGIGAAGLAGLVAGVAGYEPGRVWLLLGAISAVVAAGTWGPLQASAPIPASGARLVAPPGAPEWRLIVCYAGFGFGYIIPATFLPAMAREVIGDPAVFGWIWPAFGATAAASTVIGAMYFQHAAPRRLWAASLLVMAIGVLAPALFPGVWTLLAAAVCVGGTFMVTTMAGMQEARRLAGAGAPRLMAALTAAFALGQLTGPIVVGLAASRGSHGLAAPSMLAAACLLTSAWALRRPEPATTPPPHFKTEFKTKGNRP
jgi:MFS family permease